ncbi:MAG: hypothetical protein ACI4SC_04065 [Candidatus Neoclostridium sp.]
MEVKMLDNVGNTLKKLGKFLWVLGIVCAGIGVLVMFILLSDEVTAVMWWIGLIAAGGGLFSLWIMAFLVYGFGELIDKQTEIAANTAIKEKQPTEKNNYYATAQEQQFDSDDIPNI